MSAQLKAWYGGNSAPMEAIIDGGGGVGIVLRLNLSNGGGIRFDESPVKTTQMMSPAEWKNADWIIRPRGNINPGQRYELREIWVDLGISGTVSNAPTNVEQQRSIVNFFDVTDLSNQDWDWFNDQSRGGRVRVDNSPSNSRITMMMYVIELRPKNRTYIEVPRAFARVRGLAPSSSPTEISELVITQPQPLGLDLPASTITQGSYATARQSLDADGVRLDFAVTRQISGLELLAKIANQGDLRQHWDAGRHVLKRKPNLSALDPAFRIFRDDDVLQGSLRRSRSGIQLVINRLEASYRISPRIGGPSRVAVREDIPSQTQFGERPTAILLDLIHAGATAGLVATRSIERSANPRWIVEFDLPLVGLELRPGDLIELQHKQFSFAKGEILALPITTGAGLRVRVRAIVWEE